MNALSTFILIVFLPYFSYSCSAFKFVTEDDIYVGKNFDWYLGDGYLLQNNRNVDKCTYLLYGGQNTCWTSKYGSVTFNQNGKEFPYGGMNEKGLVVEMLWLKETLYADGLVGASRISELEWIQYQLDNHSSIAEVIQSLEKLEIDPVTATIHYFITDSAGESAIVEFIAGEPIVTRSSDDIQTITNSTYQINSKVFQENKSSFGETYKPSSLNTFSRYCAVQNALEYSEGVNFTSSSAFSILTNVSEAKGSYKSYWSIVYDIANQRINFKTFKNPIVKTLDFAKLDFNAGTTKSYDLSSLSDKANIHELLTDYSRGKNEALMEITVKPKLSFNFKVLNDHQMNPEDSFEDITFAENHKDVEVIINTKESSGTVKFFLADSEINYLRQGPYGASVEVTSHQTTHTLYSVPVKGQYAYGAMHDVNGNGRLDRNFMKMPTEPFAFSGKKRFFFFPPKYEKAIFDLKEELVIEIK